MADLARSRIYGEVQCSATMLAGWRLRGVSAVKIGPQIANVYARLNRTKLALCNHPTKTRDMPRKSSAFANSRFAFGRLTANLAVDGFPGIGAD